MKVHVSGSQENVHEVPGRNDHHTIQIKVVSKAVATGRSINPTHTIPKAELYAGKDETYNWQALRKGIMNEIGDVAYYDASFTEDPWSHLIGSNHEGSSDPLDMEHHPVQSKSTSSG